MGLVLMNFWPLRASCSLRLDDLPIAEGLSDLQSQTRMQKIHSICDQNELREIFFYVVWIVFFDGDLWEPRCKASYP